jgi:hypothetical protein
LAIAVIVRNRKGKTSPLINTDDTDQGKIGTSGDRGIGGSGNQKVNPGVESAKSVGILIDGWGEGREFFDFLSHQRHGFFFRVDGAVQLRVFHGR